MRKFSRNNNYIKLSLHKSEINNIYKTNKISKTIYQKILNKKRDLRNYYNLSVNVINSNKNTWYNITKPILLLERRLDVCLVRMNFSSSINESRQLIIKGKVYLNDVKVKFPNIILKIGDKIELKNTLPLTIGSLYFINIVPLYLEVNYNNFVGIYLRDPKIEDISIPITI